MSDRGIESDESASEDITFEELFESFSKVGDRRTEDIALRNIDKWFRQANIFSKEITPTDTAIVFAKISGMRKKRLSIDQFREMLDQLAEEKDMDVSELETQLEAAGQPSFSGVTKPIRGSIAAQNMERLTNPLSYTGSHKERFDESGKGLGLAGRYDVASADGYVQGYKRSGEDLDEQENKAERRKSREEQSMKLKQAERRKSREEIQMKRAERRKSREEQQMKQAERRKSREEQPMKQAERRKSREEQPMKQAERRKSREQQPMKQAERRKSREEQPMREAGKRKSREEQYVRGEEQSIETQPMRETEKTTTREERQTRLEEDASEEDEK